MLWGKTLASCILWDKGLYQVYKSNMDMVQKYRGTALVVDKIPMNDFNLKLFCVE